MQTPARAGSEWYGPERPKWLGEWPFAQTPAMFVPVNPNPVATCKLQALKSWLLISHDVVWNWVPVSVTSATLPHSFLELPLVPDEDSPLRQLNTPSPCLSLPTTCMP